MAVLAFWLTMWFMSRGESASCPSGTAAVNIASTADLQILTDLLACEGEGQFNITWYASLAIEERIEVSNKKNVTVTGTTFRSFDGGLGDDNGAGVIIDARRGTGIFSVSNGSTLHLNNLVLEGGNTENGGAVDVFSSSSLFVFGCIFRNNNASNGGENPILAYDGNIVGRFQSHPSNNSATSTADMYYRRECRRALRPNGRDYNCGRRDQGLSSSNYS